MKYGVKPLKDFWGCLTRKRRGYRRFYLYIELSIYLVKTKHSLFPPKKYKKPCCFVQCYRFCTMYHAQTYLYLSKVFPEEFSMELYALIKVRNSFPIKRISIFKSWVFFQEHKHGHDSVQPPVHHAIAAQDTQTERGINCISPKCVFNIKTIYFAHA